MNTYKLDKNDAPSSTTSLLTVTTEDSSLRDDENDLSLNSFASFRSSDNETPLSVDSTHALETDKHPCTVSKHKPSRPRQSHALYLHSHGRPRCVPIRFSGGMDAKTCEEYHRYLDEEDRKREEKKSQRHKLKRRISGLSSAFRRSSLTSAVTFCRRDSSCTHRSSTTSHQDCKEEDESNFKSRYAVSFSNDVTVFPTPHRSSYPRKVYESIWYDSEQLLRDIARNKLEFAYDRYNWKEATEEDDMVLHKKTVRNSRTYKKKRGSVEGSNNFSRCEQQLGQELVHPVHFHGLVKKSSNPSSMATAVKGGFKNGNNSSTSSQPISACSA